MFTTIRRKLQTARNALGFCRARPMDNPGYIAAVNQLGEDLTRAEGLATQEFLGHDTVSSSVKTKAELRRAVQENLVVLGGVADAAAVGQKDLSLRVILPRVNTNHRTFLTAARSAVEKATARKDMLITSGLPEGLVEEIATALDQYEHAAEDKSTGRSAHVGASAELIAITERIMQLIQQLDAINRYRFKNDRELLAAWKSVRDIEWPHPGKDETAPGPSGPTPVV
jgi:hypothetical protein